MWAYIVNKYGEDAKFEKVDLPDLEVNDYQVLVEVRASSLNPIDHKILTVDVGINPPLPAILHVDMAGVVSAVGSKVSNFKVGDEVFGCTGGVQSELGALPGALAQYQVTDPDLLTHKPSKMSFVEAASLALVGLTALYSMRRVDVIPGSKVLIHGGCGGVGHILIQLAKAMFPEVQVHTTISSDHKAKLAQSLGADLAINYKQSDLSEQIQDITGGEGYDVVYDTVGGNVLEQSFDLCKPSGNIVGIVGRGTYDLRTMHVRNQSLHIVFMMLQLISGIDRPHQQLGLEQLADLVETGALSVMLDKHQFTFAQAADAHALYSQGGHIGKIGLLAQ